MKIKLLFILSIISQIIFAQDNVNPSDLDPIEKVQLTTSETTSYFGNAISFSADGIMINDAAVLAKNIDASNGVIHVIDAVLIPSSMSRRDTMATAEIGHRQHPSCRPGD